MSASHLAPRRRPLRRVGAWTVNLVLVVVTLAGLGYLATGLLGYERYVITGGSMSGTFERGSIAFEQRTPVQDLAVGDIITYQPPADSGVTTLVTHRIIKIARLDSGALKFQTQGDANPDPDPWAFQLVNGDQPVVQHSVPMAGWIFIGLADHQTRMIAVGIPAGLVALLSLVEIGRALRRDDADEPDAELPTSVALVGAR